jgi:phage terminase small subunit
MTTENKSIVLADPGPECGEKMALCTPMQRRFVMALLMLGDLSHAQAARLAGSKASSANSLNVAAHQMFHNERVQAAIHEQAANRLSSAQIMASSQLVILAHTSTNESVRLKALLAILDRTGHHQISETHVLSTNYNVNLDQDLDNLALLVKNSKIVISPDIQKMIDDRQKKMKMIDITPEREYADPDADILGGGHA